MTFSCVTPAGTSNELDVQNEWEENTTHTVGGLNLHLDNTAVQNILSDRMLGIKGTADHSRWTCVDRPSCYVDKKLHNNAPHRKCLRKRRLPASACLFSLESGMALSPTVLRTTPVQ